MKSSRSYILTVTLCLCGGSLTGQLRSTQRAVIGQGDKQLTFPGTSGESGQKDASAVTLVKAYLSSVGSEPWKGLYGEGLIYIGGDSTQQAHYASLAVDSEGRSRLDLDLATGKRSVRMSGLVGGVAQENGAVLRYPASVSAAGLFVTPHTLSEALRSSNSSLIDGGTVSIGDASFREITYIRPLNAKAAVAKSILVPPLATTLLFDPTSHLLIKSVDAVRLSETSGIKSLRVITFSDYRTADQGMVPYAYVETLDGNVSYRLVLNTAKGECTQGKEYFDLTSGVR